MCFLIARLLLLISLTAGAAWGSDRPNMIFILCDDLGYGDVKCFNPDGKIATPHMDAMAARGMKFTDAHSSSAVCTPTRYGIMTGRYNWRSRLQRGVLGGLSPRLIEEGRMTTASMLKSQGYHTACIGKWHLGMDWVKLPGKEITELAIETEDQVRNVDYTRPASNGPNSVGFDYAFGISGSLDMVPYCFIENGQVVGNPTETLKLLMNKPGPESWTREGPATPGFKGEDVLPTLTRKTVEFINSRAAASFKGEPFFIYLPLNSPHTPILPSEAWKGKSGISLYADFVMETDWAVGQVVKALEDRGLLEDTLIVVSSDNGCSPTADFSGLAQAGHHPSGPFRGMKADIYEGGHHVPMVVQWPRKAQPGGVYDHPVSLLDFMATAADILGFKLPSDAAEDSVSYLPALMGQTDKPVREAIVYHSITGAFSIRHGRWKLCLAPGSAGWSEPRPGKEEKDGPREQLFDLEQDIAETRNLAAENPEVVKQLTQLLQKYVDDGRSTPGPTSKNTVTPDILSGTQQAAAKAAKK